MGRQPELPGVDSVVWRVKDPGTTFEHYKEPGKAEALCGTRSQNTKWGWKRRRPTKGSRQCNRCTSVASCQRLAVSEMPPPKPRKKRAQVSP